MFKVLTPPSPGPSTLLNKARWLGSSGFRGSPRPRIAKKVAIICDQHQGPKCIFATKEIYVDETCVGDDFHCFRPTTNPHGSNLLSPQH